MVVNRNDLDAVLTRAAELDRANERLRARNAEIERQLGPTTEEDRNRARLAEALAREQAEAQARDRAREDEECLRALAKLDATAGMRKAARATVVVLGLAGLVAAVVDGSFAVITMTLALAIVALAAIGPR